MGVVCQIVKSKTLAKGRERLAKPKSKQWFAFFTVTVCNPPLVAQAFCLQPILPSAPGLQQFEVPDHGAVGQVLQRGLAQRVTAGHGDGDVGSMDS